LALRKKEGITAFGPKNEAKTYVFQMGSFFEYHLKKTKVNPSVKMTLPKV